MAFTIQFSTSKIASIKQVEPICQENLKITDCHDIIFEHFKKFTNFRPIKNIPLELIIISNFAMEVDHAEK